MTRRRVLHLAYEDPLAPGSGGGSVRTREINERLAQHFAITTVTVPFPGSRPRTEAGVRYEHLGATRGSKFARQAAYFAKLPLYARRHAKDYDLVVEDFGAPVGSVGIPHFTDQPVIGVVQWLFAAQKSKQYHLPFTAIEGFGLRSHRRLITVSEGMAIDIRRRHPAARVDVIENGLAEPVLTSGRSKAARGNVLFLGRLDVEHKGLDLLLDAFVAARGRIEQHLDIAGDGPGEQWLHAEIDRLGLHDRVRMIGRVAEDERFEVLGRYDVVAMPSRYESFGMVAAEAAAVGTPVIAFDIPCLRELVPVSLRVPAFDQNALAEKLVEVCSDGRLRSRLGAKLPATVRHLSWDALADRQGTVYDEVLTSARPLRSVR